MARPDNKADAPASQTAWESIKSKGKKAKKTAITRAIMDEQ